MITRLVSATSAIAVCALLCAPAAARATEPSGAVTEAPAMAAPADADTAEAAPEPTITVDRAIAPIDLALVSHQAEEAEPAFTVSGSGTIISDYRFRGISQTDNSLAVEAGITIAHESGLYVGAWGSNLAGWGTFGGANVELDLIGGFRLPVGEGVLDAGLTWYMYPSGADETDFAELFAKLSGSIGPLGLTAGVAYAPQQEALGNVFFTGARAAAGLPNAPGDKEDNLYLFGDAAYGIANTPLTLKAHLGYSDGNPGLGPNGTSVAPTGTYFDWLLGVDIVPISGLILSIAYVDTDISDADELRLRPNFSALDGESIADATLVIGLTAAF